jgi:hypothetical protein
MKREYDLLSGKFYCKGADLRLPIYPDPKLQRKLERLARKKGKDVDPMSRSGVVDIRCVQAN